ncbi:MAG: putative colanic acid biosynthesis UDP-glucose lipid carrier transferase [Paraglaciecola sp.]
MKSFKKFKHSSNTYSFLYRLIDLVSIIFALFLATVIYDTTFSKDHLIMVLIVSVVFLYVAEALELYQSWRVGSFNRMTLTVWGSLIVAFMVLLVLSFMFKYSEQISRMVVGIWSVLTLLFCFMSRVISHQFKVARRKLGINLKKVGIIGATRAGSELYNEMMKNDELGFQFVGFFDDRKQSRTYRDLVVLNNVEKAIESAQRGEIDVLYIALPLMAEHRVSKIITLLGDTTADVHIVPDILMSSLVHARITHVGNIDTLSIFESPYLGTKLWLKRTLDLLVSICILVLITPMLMVISVAIKLTSKGPVLFKQHRYGLRGDDILVWKFRTMTVMDSGKGDVIQATKNDSRITALGRFLRRTSLDELPQFFNVLKGDMSVVGPRPHAVAHNEEYRRKVQFYMLRHQVKPGITGWAQISGWRGETDTLEKMEKRIEFDLHYIKNWSLWLDIKIIFLTIFKGFVGQNAY